MKEYDINVPKLEENHKFNRLKFFTEWEKVHIKNDWTKDSISGHIFSTLQRYEQAFRHYEKSLADY
ncbi:MAG: hypothetical protein PVH88_03785 [Ignavibacteria bacterium]